MYNLVISILLFIVFCLIYYIYKLNNQLKEQYSVDTNNVFNLAYKIKEYLYSNPKVTTRMLADKIIEFRSYLFFPDPSDIELPQKKKD